MRISAEPEWVGWGDAACWPGFGSDPLAVRAHAQRLVDDRQLLGEEVLDLADVARLTACIPPTLPELRYALELALLDALARSRAQPLANLFARRPRTRVAVHHLVSGVAEARAAVARGARCLKLKVGAWPAPDAVTRVEQLREALPDVRLRLDVNGGWTADEAERTLASLERFDLDWVEQPLPAGQLTATARLRASSPIPLVLDEDLGDLADLEAIVEAKAADGVVIKPMFSGGLLASAALARRASAEGLRVCVTHALDSVVGRTGALHLVAATPEINEACGLGRCLETDLAPSPNEVGSWIELPQGPGLGMEPTVPACTPEEVA